MKKVQRGGIAALIRGEGELSSEIGSEVAEMSFLIAIAVLLVGIGFLASAVITLLAMIAPGGIVLLVGYGTYRLVATLRAIERERATAQAKNKGDADV